MDAITLPQPKRKVIDLSGNTFRTLSIMAAQKGTNLKNYIEEILDRIVEERDDNETFAWLSKNYPDGHVFLTDEEQKEFEDWLGI